MTAEHSELGGSIAKRFMNCPGCIRACRDLPAQPVGEPAENGTAMHEAAALCLTGGHDAVEMIGRVFNAREIDDAKADDIQIYVDHCRTRPADAVRWVEQRFTLESLSPPVPMFGTADHVAYLDGTLWVDDLKTGWRDVDADDNVQLRYYALGALIATHPLPVTRVLASIVQPRKGGVKPTEFDVYELFSWAEVLLDAARATQEPDAPLIAGPWCEDTYCPAAGVCPANAKQALAVAQAEFADAGPYSPPAPETLTPDDVARMLPQVPAFEAWVKAFTAHAHSLAGAGLLPDWKLVATEGREAWRDKETVAKELARAARLDVEDLQAPPVALSPAKARGVIAESVRHWSNFGGLKITKKQAEVEARVILAPFTHRPNTGTALVSVTDSRPALACGGAEFTALPAED